MCFYVIEFKLSLIYESQTKSVKPAIHIFFVRNTPLFRFNLFIFASSFRSLRSLCDLLFRKLHFYRIRRCSLRALKPSVSVEFGVHMRVRQAKNDMHVWHVFKWMLLMCDVASQLPISHNFQISFRWISSYFAFSLLCFFSLSLDKCQAKFIFSAKFMWQLPASV